MRIFYWAFALIGTLFFVIGLAIYLNTRAFIASSIQAEGLVIDMIARRSDGETTYAPKVEFVAENGETYTFVSSLGSSPPTFRVGQSVGVRYQGDDPDRARVKGFVSNWVMPLAFSFFGLVFGSFGYTFIFYRARRQRLIAVLKQNGKRIMVSVTGVREVTNISYNGRHPFIIEAKWRDPITGELVRLSSDHVWEDPREKLPVQLPAFVNPDDLRQHFLDVGGLAN